MKSRRRAHIFLQITLALPLLLSMLSIPNRAAAQDPTPSELAEPDSGAVVCPPGVYPDIPDDCFPLGPSQFLTEMAEIGITYPITPLPAYRPGRDLSYIPYQYFRVDSGGAPLFASMAAALSNQPFDYLAPGLLYVAYAERVETEGTVLYRLPNGVWMRGDGSRISPPTFQGLLFSSSPRNSFGWVLTQIPSRTSPGNNSPSSGFTYYRFNVVQIYAEETIGGSRWYQIGAQEWVEARQVARIEVRTNPPPGITGIRWIEINLAEQTIAVYDNFELIFATLVSSGVDPFWTRPGLFTIYLKQTVDTMSGAFEADRSDYYYLEAVPWIMYFDEKRAMHGAYWHTFFGYQQSHGCVNLSIGDARWIFDWAAEGDQVYVYDPYGTTPTDPSLYGAGAP
ncbi:MAG: L,D-transpeptidase [Chloroflexota bacterium]